MGQIGTNYGTINGIKEYENSNMMVPRERTCLREENENTHTFDSRQITVQRFKKNTFIDSS